MIEGFLVLALLMLVLLYAERKSNRETIERQNYRIRHLTGDLNREDEEENKNIQDNYNFEKILRLVKAENNFKGFILDDIIDEAKSRFEKEYGYEFRDPFNNYEV